MVIKILGSGCKKCKKLEENTKIAIKALDVDCIIEKVTGLTEIAGYGVMMTPALVIDEEVKSTGKVLSPDEISKMIKQ